MMLIMLVDDDSNDDNDDDSNDEVCDTYNAVGKLQQIIIGHSAL